MLNAFMLLGLVGLAIPVIIHLIQKQRLKPQQLATLQFLDREDVANAFAPVPRDWLQLILRLLLLFLFILLMTRLVIGGREPGPRALAIIVDQSMSMQQKAGGRPLFETSKARVLELIDGLRPGDKMALILAGDRVSAETGYLQDKKKLRHIAGTFEATEGGGLALVPAIRNATHQLRSRREVNAAVIVFSDHQRLNYQHSLDEIRQSGSDNRSAAFRRALDRSRVKLYFIDPGAAPAGNFAIENGRFVPERVYLGAGAKFTASIRNLSPATNTTRITVIEGTQAGESRSVTLDPGETAQVDLAHRFESPVDTPCRAAIDDDSLLADNRFDLPMRMKERRQVLLVAAGSARGDDDEGTEVRYQGVDLLAYALNPGEALGQGAGTYINVKRVTPALLDRIVLPVYSVVIVHGNAELSAQSARDIKAFVENGGGLCLLPDDSVAPARFNETWGPLLGGFALGPTRAPDLPQPLDRNEARLAAPVLAPLLRGEWGEPRDIQVREYFTAAAPGQGEAALRAANGDPLALVFHAGRGRIWVQLFGMALDASSLPRTVSFVPYVQEIVATLDRATKAIDIDTLRVGEILHLRLPEFRGLNPEIDVVGPVRRTFRMGGPDGDEARIDGLDRAGAYEVSHPARKSGRKRWLTVNPVEGESELTPLAPAEQEALFGARNVDRVPYAGLADRFTRKVEILPFITSLVLLAFLAEALAGAWQSRRRRRPGARKEVAA